VSEQEFAKACQREVERIEHELRAASRTYRAAKLRAKQARAPHEKTMILKDWRLTA
jgi:hypothetical protein